jgi:hypothetical protein
MKSLVVSCPVEGTFIVNTLPIPIGKTVAGGVVVHERIWGYECEDCGTARLTTRPDCPHVAAVIGYRERPYSPKDQRWTIE